MSSRRMIYPVTLMAKVAQFPFKYHWDNSWPFKYYLISCVVAIPFFWKIERAVKSPGNVKKFEEQARKQHEEHLKHLEHLY